MQLPAMVRAALPVLPGVNRLPGVAKKGGPLPDLVLDRRDVTIDRGQVAAYSDVCGFEPRQVLPLTYPHLLAFPLHMGIMTAPSFPYPAVGTVHLRNTIHRHRPIGFTEWLDVTANAASLRSHPKGMAFDLITTVHSGDETVWESISTYLRVGGRSESAKPDGEPFEVVSGTGQVWRLPANLGRRYAAVSGDHNPIHLYPVTARAFGFPRQIAHGMWSKAGCVAAVESRLPDDVTVEVEFHKPILLPGNVAFGSRLVADGIDFALTRPKDSKPHLVGRSRAG